MIKPAQPQPVAKSRSSNTKLPLSVRIRQLAGRTRLAANYLAGRQTVEPSVTTFDDDVWYVSYPRSGNTYWRFLTANLISNGTPVDWTNIEQYAPDIYVTRDSVLRQLPRPRFLKSHEPFRPAYRHVVLIVRDPRDVAVSCFHFAKRWYMIPEEQPIEEFIPAWVDGKIYEYGKWSEFNGSWLGARRDSDNFHVFRYEDMLTNPASNLQRLVDVLDIAVAPGDIERAIENSSPDKLRALERAQKNEHKALKIGRNTSSYVRAATSNQWQTVLSPSSIRMIEASCEGLMREFGYLS